jgi:hypothetical protein
MLVYPNTMIMANNPIPDNVPDLMESDFGTIVLITDPRSDVYLNQYRKLICPPSETPNSETVKEI